MFAQTKDYRIVFRSEQDTTSLTLDDISDSARILRDWLEQQRSDGHLAANIDSTSLIENTLIVYAFKGSEYAGIHFNSHNIPASFLDSSVNYLALDQFRSISEGLLTEMENNGYPFASIYLREATVRQDSLFATLFFDRGMSMVYDSVVIVGNSQLSKRYLGIYLDIQQGTPYDERVIQKLDQRLRNLPLVKLKKPSRVHFYEGMAKVILYIDDRVTDRLDGVVGLSPNSSSSAEQSLLLTGEVHLELNNLFRSARQISVHWRNYLERSQSLETSFSWPYILQTKLGINGQFKLNKYDSLFLTVERSIGIRYQQKGNNYFQVYYKKFNSNLLSVDTSSIRTNANLPQDNPYESGMYGLSYFQQNLDYLPNPQRGYVVNTDISIGIRTLKRDLLIDEIKFTHPDFSNPISLYDTTTLRSARIRFDFSLKGFIPLGKLGCVAQSVRAEGIMAPNVLRNESYLIGGFHSLQGFDENSLFASKYVMYRLEYRYLFDQNSFAAAFINTAALWNSFENTLNFPYGVGISTQLDLGRGVMQLAYALGGYTSSPLELRTGKIHFGMVNYF